MPLSGFSKLKLSERVYAHVDCNSFYCSCERVFRPEFNGKPVGVLSNNDGCIIALTPELKALGVAMGAPLHLNLPLIRKYKVGLFSSNYELYGDMSARVMNVLREFSPQVEVYSIDEAFIDLTHYPGNELDLVAQAIRDTVKQWTGIPVGVGIGRTKTLAKLANRLSKEHGGICSLLDSKRHDALFKTLPVTHTWGVSRRLVARLDVRRIKSIWDLKMVDDDWLMKNFPVTVMRTVMELRGVSCIPLTEAPKPKKHILNSRSFGNYIYDLPTVQSAVAFHASRGAQEMRMQGLCAHAVWVGIWTNEHRPDHSQHYGTATVALTTPTDYTPILIQAALRGLQTMWRPDYAYQKAGVMMLDLVPERSRQNSLLSTLDSVKGDRLMQALDKVNSRMGAGTLKFGTEGFKNAWAMHRNFKSPSYTTNWLELLKIT